MKKASNVYDLNDMLGEFFFCMGELWKLCGLSNRKRSVGNSIFLSCVCKRTK